MDESLSFLLKRRITFALVLWNNITDLNGIDWFLFEGHLPSVMQDFEFLTVGHRTNALFTTTCVAAGIQERSTALTKF